VIADWAAWLEATEPARALRDGVLLYPLVSLVHVLGIGLLLGTVVVMDLRLLGVWRTLALPVVVGPARTVAATGIAIALPSGAALLAARATDYVTNPFVAAKFIAILLALVNVCALHRSAAWRRRDGGSARLALGGGISLACWLSAVASGRLIAYW
jgi:hypothetical protein